MTLRTPSRRRVVVLSIALVLAVLAGRALDRPSPLDYYRIADERTVIVGTDVGAGAWTRVTSIVETPSTVTIAVGSFLVRLGPGTAEAIPLELVVNLRDPVGNRTVVDASTGRSIQLTHCLPPAYFAAGCTP